MESQLSFILILNLCIFNKDVCASYKSVRVLFEGLIDVGHLESVEDYLRNALHITRFSDTIEFYQQSCEDLNYIPLSNSATLRAIKPSQRKALARLDDITADAMNGFEFLQRTLKEMKSERELISKLESATR